MNKKRVFWFINQFSKIGGIEIVSYLIALSIKDDVDLHVVLLSNDSMDNKLFGRISELNITTLNIDKHIIRNEDYFKKKNIFTKIKTFIAVINYGLFSKYKYRKKAFNMTNKDDILIFSSPISYLIAPKKRNVFFHYHFNYRFFNSFINKNALRLLSIKPKLNIFLSEETMKLAKLKNSIYLYNPSRILREENFEFHNNSIVFLARYEMQKRPILALRIIKKLSKINMNFHVDFYGSGYYEKNMKQYVKNNKLTKYVSINGPIDSKVAFLKADLLIVTSSFEGFPLSIIEAASLSVPTISLNYGDGINEVIKNNVTGIIVDKNDGKMMALKINELLNNKEKLLKYKHNAFEFGKIFSIGYIKEEWVEVINKYGK